MAYTIHIEGLEELKQKLSANVTEESVKEFLAKSAMEVEKNAKLNSPVDTGRLRASINNKVEIGPSRARAIIGTNVTYACVVGGHHPVYEPIMGTSARIGTYPYNAVLSKDGEPHTLIAKHKFYKPEITAISIQTRKERNPLIITVDHLVLILRDGKVLWEQSQLLKQSDMVFGKRSHNAILDNSNKVSYLCFCGTIFWVNKYDLNNRDPKYCSCECRHKYGTHALNKGMHWELSEETKNKHRGSNNSQWRDGSCLKPYDYNFNGNLKDQVKQRDGFQCQECQSPFDLIVHHRDWNKMNSNFDNLITVCRSCHGKLNRQDCELPDVNLSVFIPKPILRIDYKTIKRDGKGNIPFLYDLTVSNENSFMVSGMIIHNSFVEFGTSPHFPPLAAMQPWARRHGFPPGNAGAYLVARAIAQHGTKGRFYMKKGFEQSLNTINTLMRALGESIKMKLEK